jgi:hypothetical protein
MSQMHRQRVVRANGRTINVVQRRAHLSYSALERLGVPIVQAMTSGMPREAWEVSYRGLSPLETAIDVAIPEFDGGIITVPMSFKDRADEAPGLYAPHPERIARVAGIARTLARLRRLPRPAVRVAFVLTNSSSKASQVGSAVGLAAPASLLTLLRAMRRDGYTISDLPATSEKKIASKAAAGAVRPTNEPWSDAPAYLFAALDLGHAIVALQRRASRQLSARSSTCRPAGGPARSCDRDRRDLRHRRDVVVVVTDGHANVPSRTDDPWADTLTPASAVRCPSLVVDSEDPRQPTRRSHELADAMRGSYARLSDLEQVSVLRLVRERA